MKNPTDKIEKCWEADTKEGDSDPFLCSNRRFRIIEVIVESL